MLALQTDETNMKLLVMHTICEKNPNVKKNGVTENLM